MCLGMNPDQLGPQGGVRARRIGILKADKVEVEEHIW